MEIKKTTKTPPGIPKLDTFKQYKNISPKVLGRMRYVSIRTSGQFGFNKTTHDMCKLEETPYVRMYYNDETNEVAFKFFEEPVMDTFKLGYGTYKNSKRPQYSFIHADTFCKKYGIPTDTVYRFWPYWFEEERIILIRLDEPIGVDGKCLKFRKKKEV